MADIYAFPTGESNDGRPVRPQGVPDEVWAAVESVSTMKRIHDVRYREIPVPSTLADYGIGVEFEAGERALGDAFSAGLGSDAESRIATGWIMMLYAHELRIDWDSNWRCVAFARLPLETAENDSLTPGMYWDDMCDYFDGIEPDSVSGTVTVTGVSVITMLYTSIPPSAKRLMPSKTANRIIVILIFLFRSTRIHSFLIYK